MPRPAMVAPRVLKLLNEPHFTIEPELDSWDDIQAQRQEESAAH